MLFNQGYYEEAKADCARAISLRPDFTDAYNNLGLAYAGLNAVKESLPFYDEAIRLNPNFTEAYINRGNAYDSLGRSQEALGDYGRAIELNPSGTLAYLNRAITYYRLKEYGKALADLEKLKESARLRPSSSLRTLRRRRGGRPLQLRASDGNGAAQPLLFEPEPQSRRPAAAAKARAPVPHFFGGLPGASGLNKTPRRMPAGSLVFGIYDYTGI